MLDIVPALANAFPVIGEPGTALLDEFLIDSDIQKVAGFGNAFAEGYVVFHLFERRRDFVFHNLDADTSSKDICSIFDLLSAAQLQTDRGVELQREAAGSRIRIAEHYPDFLTNLVGKDNTGLGFIGNPGQFSECLGHQARQQTDVRVAHFAFNLCLRCQRRDRVNNHQINRAAPDERLDDFQSLFACIGLRDEQVLHVHADVARVSGVQRVFNINEHGGAAQFLDFGDDVEAQGGFPSAFMSINFNDSAARHTADTECQVQRERAGGDGFNRDYLAIGEAHNRAFAEFTFDLRNRLIDDFLFLWV